VCCLEDSVDAEDLKQYPCRSIQLTSQKMHNRCVLTWVKPGGSCVWINPRPPPFFFSYLWFS
jgi:hypothetical protein